MREIFTISFLYRLFLWNKDASPFFFSVPKAYDQIIVCLEPCSETIADVVDKATIP
jgi:hypothetical protein